jgi:hypothetical protein
MIGHYNRHIGPRFGRGNRFCAPTKRGYRRHTFFYARPGSHRVRSRRPQLTAEQQALRGTAREVARLFVIAARAALGSAEQQSQLRAILERSRSELSSFIDRSSQRPKPANTENVHEVEQA